MTPLQRYIAEEIAIDHADGLLTRREALRRLGLIGLGVAAASSLLAACSTGGDEQSSTSAPVTPGGATPPPPGVADAVGTEAVTFPGPDGRVLQGAWAEAAEPRGAVLVVHENKGLTDHIRSVAGRFAGAGYSALAVDLLSEEGGTATFTDQAQATAALATVPPERFVADMKAGVDELARRVPDKKYAAVGFCFGGGMVWQLLASGEPRLAAAVPFYGPLPDGADFSGSKAAVLAIYAELDARVNASRDAADAALTKAGLPHEIVTVPGADHAFFNDTGPRYNAAAAAEAYERVLTWFGEYVG
ncbi:MULTISPECIES: dienelactone hydrolase family protein [unclassified Rhodococcus (in: high G+C Gram-positive bacteria)]|uniref:dienelactone hydrolase family protein n=1 Tax=unclassified Rhodococcus (in: high G+C Gram-positive bacteria) TaxID=192944 RepID=UPI00163A3BFA|nr:MULTISPECIES: dienelactone hydrolase family protein [unclassified Rhodococcus (in: high G+C Gram-positive bacteria)]MBC2639155.1 dienelactone hydrolase family protein [Rhodococcus sp. 3A]MBC2896103.1 dienelactone hydrolase family protein [Rhodococcus sp. 4CII]